MFVPMETALPAGRLSATCFPGEISSACCTGSAGAFSAIACWLCAYRSYAQLDNLIRS